MKEELSDKVYWHKYTSFYDMYLPKEAKNILEIGVLRGDSIRYWNDKYKNTNIYGLDIIDELEEWPKANNISYFKIDQSDAVLYNDLLKKLNVKHDIIIEDGSHDPLHQKISLIESLDFIQENGIYILEDIHTSHQNHSYYKARVKQLNENRFFFSKKEDLFLMPLQALLMLQHINENEIDINSIKEKLDFNLSIFSFDELVKINSKVKSINFYKRTVLPNYCYRCHGNNFNYITQKCNCGTVLMSETDSMSVILKFK